METYEDETMAKVLDAVSDIGAMVAVIQKELAEVRQKVNSMHGVVVVNQELISNNIRLNEKCGEQPIAPIPPLKLDTKIVVNVEPWTEHDILLTGSTFDIKDTLKSEFSARFNSIPADKKGWVVSRSALGSVLDCERLKGACVFHVDSSLQ